VTSCTRWVQLFDIAVSGSRPTRVDSGARGDPFRRRLASAARASFSYGVRSLVSPSRLPASAAGWASLTAVDVARRRVPVPGCLRLTSAAYDRGLGRHCLGRRFLTIMSAALRATESASAYDLSGVAKVDPDDACLCASPALVGQRGERRTAIVSESGCDRLCVRIAEQFAARYTCRFVGPAPVSMALLPREVGAGSRLARLSAAHSGAEW